MSARRWEQTKQKIEKTLDEIYVDMPLEVKKLKAGILPHNAGHTGQYFSALESLMMTLMGWCFYSGGMIMEMLNDPSFTLEQCKKLVITGNRNPARYTGYIAYPTVWNLWLEIEESLASVDSKDHLKELMVSWLSFINRMHFWNVEVFPWHLAAHLQTKTVAEIDGRRYFTGKVAVNRSPVEPENVL
jgi:cucumopine synthase-like protein